MLNSKRNFLKPCNQKIKKYKLYGFDIETYGKHNKFLMGSIVNENEKYVFWNQKEMQDFILTNRNLYNSRVYASNLGFDFLGLFGNEFNNLSKFSYIIRGSEFINISYSKNNINFGDTFNFLKMSVKNLGKIINIPKLNTPSFLGKKPKNETEKKILETYNIRDSYVTFKFMEFLQNGFNDLGTSLKYTIASTSLNLFKNKYLKTWIQQPDLDDIKIMYNAYYGGRTEIFYRGLIKNVYLYDINSLYPYVMKKYEYPNPNTLFKPKNFNKENIIKYDGISFVSLFCPLNIDYPLLPYRRDEKLIFPTGFINGWYSNVELRKSFDLGYKLLKIHKQILYKSNFKIFDNYISDLYKKRLKYKEENNNLQIVYKIALNSLYGKFAQKLNQSEIYFVNNQEDKNKVNEFIKTNIERKNKGLDIRYYIDTPDKRLIKKSGVIYEEPRLYYVVDLENSQYPKFINPILSLYITAYARLELYNWFEKIFSKNGKVFYCDTDSVITNIKLPESSGLGKMKKEYDIKKGILIKPKFYYMKCQDDKEIMKLKGLMKVNNFEQFKNILITQRHKYIKFTKFKESLRRDLNFNQIIEIEKFLDLEDNKRIWKNKKINFENLEKSKPHNITLRV